MSYSKQIYGTGGGSGCSTHVFVNGAARDSPWQITSTGERGIYYDGGNVAIGKTTASFTLDISGNVSAATITASGNVSAVSFNTTSDYRIKDNVTPLDETYGVDGLNPVTYLNTKTNKHDIGLIAHELQEIYPLLVNGEKDGDTMQSVNYTGLIPILINEVKNLKKENNNLETKHNNLENELNDLKKELNDFKNAMMLINKT